MRRRQFVQAATVAGVSPVAFARGRHEGVRVGLTAVMLADQTAFLARWSAFLAQRTGTRVEFAVRDAYQDILDLLFAGDLDAAWICGYPYVRYQSRLSLLAVPLYQGQPRYQSYLIAPTDAAQPIAGWADLKGKVFAYSDPLSNSGWLVAQGQFAAAAIQPADLKRSFFAHGHRNVAEAVAAHLADAGSIDGYVWETMRQQGMPAALRTQVVWKSPLHGFPPLVVPAGRNDRTTAGLQRTLLGMGSSDDGRLLLKALNLDGFVAGESALFDSIRRLARSVPGSGVQA